MTDRVGGGTKTHGQRVTERTAVGTNTRHTQTHTHQRGLQTIWVQSDGVVPQSDH